MHCIGRLTARSLFRSFAKLFVLDDCLRVIAKITEFIDCDSLLPAAYRHLNKVSASDEIAVVGVSVRIEKPFGKVEVAADDPKKERRTKYRADINDLPGS